MATKYRHTRTSSKNSFKACPGRNTEDPLYDDGEVVLKLGQSSNFAQAGMSQILQIDPDLDETLTGSHVSATTDPIPIPSTSNADMGLPPSKIAATKKIVPLTGLSGKCQRIRTHPQASQGDSCRASSLLADAEDDSVVIINPRLKILRSGTFSEKVMKLESDDEHMRTENDSFAKVEPVEGISSVTIADSEVTVVINDSDDEIPLGDVLKSSSAPKGFASEPLSSLALQSSCYSSMPSEAAACLSPNENSGYHNKLMHVEGNNQALKVSPASPSPINSSRELTASGIMQKHMSAIPTASFKSGGRKSVTFAAEDENVVGPASDGNHANNSSQRNPEPDFERGVDRKKRRRLNATAVGRQEQSVVELNGKRYLRLDALGRGASSVVYRVYSEADEKILAYKRVDIQQASYDDADGKVPGSDVFTNYANEIELLRQLRGCPHIVEMIDGVVDRDKMYVAMVMEAGDTDLARTLLDYRKRKESLSPFFVRSVWKDMLRAVDYMHQQRVVHGDLKPANFVFVRGSLKLIDFGIAKAISNDTTNITRENTMGTVNYMAPEAICPTQENGTYKVKLGRASDIWSLGCILYQMIYGQAPFASTVNMMQRMHMITNDKVAIIYPNHEDGLAIDTIRQCLQRPPGLRPSISTLLGHAFLGTPCVGCREGVDGGVLSDLHSFPVGTKDAIVQTECIGSTEGLTHVSSSTETATESATVIPALSLNQLNNLVRSVLSVASLLQSEELSVEQFSSQLLLGGNRELLFSEASVESKKVDLLPKTSHVSMKEVIKASSENTKMQSSRGSISNLSDKENEAKSSVSLLKGSQESVSARASVSSKSVQPLRELPLNFGSEIREKKARMSELGGDADVRAKKWSRPRGETPEKKDMRSALEKRLGEMRKFFHEEDQEDSCADTSSFQI